MTVAVFSTQPYDRTFLEALVEQGTRLIALRCSGLNNVDLSRARDTGLTVGIVRTGRMGSIVARILRNFGRALLADDRLPNRECHAIGVTYAPQDDVFTRFLTFPSLIITGRQDVGTAGVIRPSAG